MGISEFIIGLIASGYFLWQGLKEDISAWMLKASKFLNWILELKNWWGK